MKNVQLRVNIIPVMAAEIPSSGADPRMVRIVRKAVGNPRPGLIVFRPGMNTDRSEIINCKLYAPQHQFYADKLPPLHEILPTPFLYLQRGR